MLCLDSCILGALNKLSEDIEFGRHLRLDLSRNLWAGSLPTISLEFSRRSFHVAGSLQNFFLVRLENCRQSYFCASFTSAEVEAFRQALSEETEPENVQNVCRIG